jgi:regulator of replication initiation timing
MKATELESYIKVLQNQVVSLQNELNDLKMTQLRLAEKHYELKSQTDKLEQRLTDHIAQVEKWDARRWGTIGFFIAGLISLVINLILAFTRK